MSPVEPEGLDRSYDAPDLGEAGERPPVAVIGAGRFGRALAQAAARSGEVLVWSRRELDLGDPNIRLTRAATDLASAELILLAVPSRYAADALERAGHQLDGGHLIVHVSRGLLDDELRTMSHLIKTLTPCRRIGALAGPISAELLVDASPGAGVVGSEFPEVVDAVRTAIASPTLRIYDSDDLRGVELAAALTGLLLFTIGFAQRAGFGPATIGALTTRGVAEVARIGRALGARVETFGGLACFGDLLAAVAGSDRPEIELGRALAEGASPEQARERAGGSIEGIEVAHRVAAFGIRKKLRTPIADVISALVEGRLDASSAVHALMGRRVTSE
ncbi:NAD(P)-binding domain-containing protein [Pseudenhygromyxa sp. WMMC2535]|uniref:NAD(P)-binding domain-containing protein n=1 Tax=Pseudenhygromyxa sp. WMMC2535 TaxID=2712867 RepID=UPI001556A0C5|nr:NAD(P)-binding domain-containing protein [Pseudenhygromyxa sp. WMMC2535]NVB42721.1 NAD(P)-binding domain-containing protein [Pseudenhygromyxa sp. WMMC2535]